MSSNIFYDGHAKRITVLDNRFYESRVKDIYYPGVTTILEVYPKGYGLMEWLKQVGSNADQILQKAGEEGSMVHQMIDDYLKGDVIKWESDEGKMLYPLHIWQMFCKFIEFFEYAEPEILSTEFSFCCEKLGYGGTIDLICMINGERWLIDHKTSNAIYKSHELQLSAYATAWNELNPKHLIDKCGILWLKALTRGEGKKGIIQGKGWQLKEFDRPYQESFKIFQHTHEIWKEENPDFKPNNLLYPSEFQRKIN